MKHAKAITRRTALKLIAGALPTLNAVDVLASAQETFARPRLSRPRFEGTRESLEAYRCPEWFRDAKFGIWAHWGPQSAAEDGDWYARNIYIQGSRQYKDHLARYGHPSRVGYKDIIPTWKGDRFDPDYLVGLYRKAGAKYFMSMGVHVDNFDLWNSRHTRWNAVNMGIRKDVVALFGKAARKHGLKFGVSDHLWMAYKWMSVAHGSDLTGPLAGVPYDGADPRYNDLYGDCPKIYRKLPWDEEGIPDKWKREWFIRIRDLVDQSEPDVLYCDGQIPFEHWGLEQVAHFYNQNLRRNGGRLDAVYTSKREEDSKVGTCVFDKERGVVDGIWPDPWQTDTCIGHWHYERGLKYKSPKRVIDMLVDVVSRNGNLLLNFPLPNSGMLDDDELKVLADITAWMAINSEAIHGTRPWKIYGEGPTVQKPEPGQKYNETNRRDLTAEDVRFTTKGNVLYAFCMGWTGNRSVIPSLAPGRGLARGRVHKVQLLGAAARLHWSQNESGLIVQLPREKPCDHAIAFKIEGLEI